MKADICYEYRLANMHAKTFVVDGAWSSLGTKNLDNRLLAYGRKLPSQKTFTS